ncbi:diglucosyl diacylglycerol synthase [Ectobacillus sp. sgz5001026]|uniref:diglucosyl diacylglycerol synthase n=1 Tax=Ectobacillus sp. sgz5001026 TaxID=3242473 RepID=UPI0036D3F74F
MSNNPKVLIFTAHYGNGHAQVAKTLEQAFHQRGIKQVIVRDLFTESHPVLTDITKYLYLKSYTIGKDLYRLFYYGVEKIYNKKFARWYANFGKRRLTSILHTEKPDIIINTFPIIAVPELKKKSGIDTPVYNVLTDFCLHKIWVHPYVDHYFVATEYVKELITNIGIPREQITTTGIPIRQNFETLTVHHNYYEKYGLNPSKKTLLILAGAHGVLGNVKELCELFMKVDNLQVVVICGKNEELRNEIQQLQGDSINVFGYVEQIDELFRISTCLITKPGGITLSEVASLQVPVVLYHPVPGQENENADYFEEMGAAVVVREEEDVFLKTNQLLKDDWKLEKMRDALRKIHNPQAAIQVVSTILEKQTQQHMVLEPVR